MRIAVIGHTDAGRRVCSALRDRGIEAVHVASPDDADLRGLLASGIDGVAIMLHDDVRALRYALGIEHLRPGIRLFVAMFDGTARIQLERTVPNCVVLSPASIAVPSMVAAAIAPRTASVRRSHGPTERRWMTVGASSGDGSAPEDGSPPDALPMTAYRVPGRLRVRGLAGRLAGQLRPYDTGSAVLLSGLFGLATILVIDTVVGMRHLPLPLALYEAARTTATIAGPPLPESAAHLVWSSVAALLVMGFTATFGAGIVHHLLSGRHAALVGRRVIPRSGHVIVAGMGQVGVRLAQELRALGIAVVGIEQVASARGVAMARDLGIPIVIGDASSRRVLRRAGLPRAIAVAAVSSRERDNITIAIAAQAVSASTRVIIRAGSDDAIAETRSLFRIGPVVDVNGLTAAFVCEAMVTQTPHTVVASTSGVRAIAADGYVTYEYAEPGRCRCSTGQRLAHAAQGS